MVDLLFVEPGDEASPQVFDGMFALRHRVFRERLGWDVNSVAGREHDLYDDLHPVYLVCRDDKQTVGCWRLLPTTGPYMLKDVFSDLLHGHPLPRILRSGRSAASPSSRQ